MTRRYYIIVRGEEEEETMRRIAVAMDAERRKLHISGAT